MNKISQNILNSSLGNHKGKLAGKPVAGWIGGGIGELRIRIRSSAENAQRRKGHVVLHFKGVPTRCDVLTDGR